MGAFPRFTALSLLYFAAASFTETARRLGCPGIGKASFLLSDHPRFGRPFKQCCKLAIDAGFGFHGSTSVETAAFADEVRRAIEPIDLAGLGDTTRRNWYPVQAGDLLAAAPKLGVSPDRIREMLRKLGIEPS
jgi:FADH2 O2-dependent halogenase